LWATHTQGVVTFTPRGESYEIDSSTFDLINAQFPAVHLLPDNDVWFSAGRALYHVERQHGGEARQAGQPMLVSVIDGQTNAELFAHSNAAVPLRLPFAQNNLSFRFFSGSYAWRRSPVYEFRLNGTDEWSPLGSGSFLSFLELREGRYRMEVRMVENKKPIGSPASFNFEILAPWHRTWPAYGLYGLGVAAALFGIVRWSGHRAYHRNLALEKLVDERTRQLKATMEKLNAETRNAATLAERDRLAGEIHDSLQQGLSGLILQLDATLKLPSAAGDLRSRLEVARNMVSFTRHEVQHAVWDMESPLLEDTELSEALRKLTDLISPGTAIIDIAVSGSPVALPSAIKHHLLRIAQEAITNAVRHASPRRISVALGYQPQSISLAVSDDGVGFRPDDVLSKSFGHFGLRGLRSRATKLGGTLQIQSEPGRGASIRVVVPFTPAPLSSSDASDYS
ncbi:MAG TPA: ATP-binding protein, partial [Opitutus sp.]|nr:ATP-binding protein [Opitutus sp.]